MKKSSLIGGAVTLSLGGVITKIFTASELSKTGPVEYSILFPLSTLLLSGGAWAALSLYERRKAVSGVEKQPIPDKRTLVKSWGLSASYGALNRVANFLLVFALAFVDSSVQYPMVTGGTMIVTALLSCFGDKKPKKREIVGIALGFIGMCALFFIPI